jgi:hypothetical protein
VITCLMTTTTTTYHLQQQLTPITTFLQRLHKTFNK